MTERHDDQDAFDDELAAALRAEVPGPGTGYWDRIDAMLERAAEERDGADPGYADSADDDMDTAATVIRLTAMNENDTIQTTNPRTTGTTRAPESTTARRFGGTSLLARAAMPPTSRPSAAGSASIRTSTATWSSMAASRAAT